MSRRYSNNMKIVNFGLVDKIDEIEEQEYVEPIVDDSFTLDRCTKSFLITGTTGSGKSSGSAAYLGLSFLEADMGGIVLCAKTEEADYWESFLCVAGGKKKDQIKRFSAESDYVFDPILYQSRQASSDDTMILVSLLISLSKIADRVNGTGGNSGDPFWENASRRLLSNVIELLKRGEEDVSFTNIDKMIRSALAYIAQAEKEGDQLVIQPKSIASFYTSAIKKMAQTSLTPSKQREAEKVMNYFKTDLGRMPENTRNSILETIYTIINPFLGGFLSEKFTGSVSEDIMPETTYEKGNVIILDFSIKDKFEAGAIAQGLYKKIFQRTIEQRDMRLNDRPVFVFCDEAQFFLDSSDYLFLTTARSKRCCSVYITQTISNFLSVMRERNSQSIVDSLISNLVTKIIHAGTDRFTNDYFADLIGKHYARITDITGDDDDVSNIWDYRYHIEPNDFLHLKTGREENHFEVEAYMVSLGNWSNGKHFAKFTFDQKAVKRAFDAVESIDET